MIDFQEIVLFFNSLKFEIIGEIFDEIEHFCVSKNLKWGYYKDDRMLNSLYIVLPQENRTVLILCPQGNDRYHCLHFSAERFEKFLLALHHRV